MKYLKFQLFKLQMLIKIMNNGLRILLKSRYEIRKLSEATILKTVILTLLLIMIITAIVVIAIKYPEIGVQ